MISAKTQCKQQHHVTALCRLTCWGVFLGATFLVEQDGSDQDYHLNHDGDEGLQGLMESDDLQVRERTYIKIQILVTHCTRSILVEEVESSGSLSRVQVPYTVHFSRRRHVCEAIHPLEGDAQEEEFTRTVTNMATLEEAVMLRR